MACGWRSWRLPPAVVERAREILPTKAAGTRAPGGRPRCWTTYRCFAPLPAPAPVAGAQALGGRARLHRPEPDTITARRALDLVYELSAMLTDGATSRKLQWPEGTRPLRSRY